MQKLKYDIIKKLMESEVTSTEINLLLYMSHYQSDRGSVTGVYYKSVSDELNISYQAFYDALYGLEKKGFIMIRKGSYYDWDVLILNHDCQGYDFEKNSDKISYLRTGRDIFYSQQFYRLKAKEKLLAMYILVLSEAGKGYYQIGTKEFYNKFQKLFQVTKRALQNYLQKLKGFFSIGIKDKKYWMRPKKSLKEKKRTPTNKKIFAEGITAAIVRRTRAVFTDEDYRETEKIASQYFPEFQYTVQKGFMRAVERSIELRNESIANKYKWSRALYPSFIHRLLREELYAIKA